MDTISDVLIELGLSHREASTYLALLELDLTSVSQISRHTGINRSTTYVVLNSLEKMNLVKVADDRKVRKYMGVSPDMLLANMKKVTDSQAKRQTELEEIMPKLRAIYKDTSHKPLIKIYEGKKGLWQTYTDVFESGVKEFWVCEDLTNILKIFPEFVEYDATQRLMKGISICSISPAKKADIKLCSGGPCINTEEIAFIPPEMFTSPVDITIYGDRVAFASSKDLFGVTIEHPEIATALKSIFDLAFAEARQLDRKLNIPLEPVDHFTTPDDKTKMPALLKELKKSFERINQRLESEG
ncbi:MAG TPA: helix-turn-helix domain-containing protein [Patescibacteria group bacterium]|nr:helix-turn-helix domain-containing protein [Candidatus Saccharimonadales bacterium]HSX46509.1 helix-turn-helix domain-containing protein [Patescibacteria group bacterium]